MKLTCITFQTLYLRSSSDEQPRSCCSRSYSKLESSPATVLFWTHLCFPTNENYFLPFSAARLFSECKATLALQTLVSFCAIVLLPSSLSFFGFYLFLFCLHCAPSAGISSFYLSSCTRGFLLHHKTTVKDPFVGWWRGGGERGRRSVWP
jgi:hypothetical protein